MSAHRRVLRVVQLTAIIIALPASCVLKSLDTDRPEPGTSSVGAGGAPSSSSSEVGGGTTGSVGQGGAPITTSSSSSSAGGDGGMTGAGGAGGPKPECMLPAECPQPDPPCASATCVAGKCGVMFVPAGEAPGGSPTDCIKIQCNGAGVSTPGPAPGEVPPDDGNPCTSDICDNNGAAVHPAKPFTTACPGGYCDGAGVCKPAQCAAPNDCGAAPQCNQYSCVNGACVLSPSPAATFCNGFADQCDGLGNCVDCVNSGGCDECCVCSNHVCIQA